MSTTTQYYRRATILGCGSSGGVPRIGGIDGTGDWGSCDPNEPKNRRLRCSLLVEQSSFEDFPEDQTTRILVDTSPDLREQLIENRVRKLDAVLYTHDHADHTHGLDDLRVVVFHTKKMLNVWADNETGQSLVQRFSYAFEQPANSDYQPILSLRTLTPNIPITIRGAGGEISALPLQVEHGSINALGFRFDSMAYIPDVSHIYDHTFSHLKNLDCFIIDALRYRPHPTHAHLEKTLSWIEQLDPKRSFLTNMHIDMDYATLIGKIAPNVKPAFDKMQINY